MESFKSTPDPTAAGYYDRLLPRVEQRGHFPPSFVFSVKIEQVGRRRYPKKKRRAE